ncbi:MAG: putative toxin-antitoxin system toxin component, PIN family [Deltaproteobacteria bacterium]|nr:MAG: putative toxin-antitoxin system toxin component, PIN family [Deltaproteobacteria bacterium]
MFDVVFDTNVLVSTLRSRRGASFKLLSLIDQGLYQLHLSVPLLFEYESVLKRDCAHSKLLQSDIDDVLNYLCQVSKKKNIFYLWRPQLKDPKDDFILELAVESRCKFIVTFNKKDFVGSEPFGITPILPKDFLKILGGKNEHH